METQTKKYVIVGKRWFDKINGNTYHSVKVVDVETNKEIVNIPFNYGYDEQYIQTAYDELIKLGLADKKDRFNHDLNRTRFIISCSDVARKKDL